MAHGTAVHSCIVRLQRKLPPHSRACLTPKLSTKKKIQNPSLSVRPVPSIRSRNTPLQQPTQYGKRAHRCLNRQVHGSAPAPGLEVPVRHHATPQRHGAAHEDDHRPEHIYEDGACTRGLLQRRDPRRMTAALEPRTQREQNHDRRRWNSGLKLPTSAPAR